ncbi:hypothetical protein JW977_00740, partial [Candidatus Falkowbacteria bacterium]|nr:hypothetical protein [Candidatus Falkowbacteria bacterium]
AGAASVWSTSAGALTVDSAAALNLGSANATSVSLGRSGITTTNNGALTVSENFTANGTTITLGNANTDNVVYVAEVQSDIIPDADNTYDLGTSTQRWQDIYVKGGSLHIGNDGDDVTLGFDIANDYLTSTDSIQLAAGLAYTGAGAVTLSSAAASTLTVDSGTTGALNIGTGANAKTITIGNSTTTTALILDAGTGGVKIGDSTATPIINHLSVAAAVDIGTVTKNTCLDTSVTVTGAALGDTIIASPTPVINGIETYSLLQWNYYISAIDTVIIRACNHSTSNWDPDNQTWRFDVWKH